MASWHLAGKDSPTVGALSEGRARGPKGPVHRQKSKVSVSVVSGLHGVGLLRLSHAKNSPTFPSYATIKLLLLTSRCNATVSFQCFPSASTQPLTRSLLKISDTQVSSTDYLHGKRRGN